MGEFHRRIALKRTVAVEVTLMTLDRLRLGAYNPVVVRLLLVKPVELLPALNSSGRPEDRMLSVW